ncbi:MAG: lasso peptide biosynthesis B2 protein [Candidatus Cohnella colombiensis]|uniref:Lasso peptide biosynthesis B2 protein n=1 Tax=Candidatus Cohnella colombiensis TaxID=3121368 RepID=A0AA95EY27_9BACL|nr:MAG: lasso peptide biosynthesis B2 protein [Cohnella sp.]
MNAVKYVRRLFSLDAGMVLLMIESFFYLGWSRILITLPFAKIAPSLGARNEETRLLTLEKDTLELKRLSTALNRMSRHTLWDSRCLVRAIAALKMLDRRGISSTLYLGTAKEQGGEMIAHAWLRSGTLYITGAEEMRRFTVVGTFAKNGQRLKDRTARRV